MGEKRAVYSAAAPGIELRVPDAHCDVCHSSGCPGDNKALLQSSLCCHPYGGYPFLKDFSSCDDSKKVINGETRVVL